MPDFADAIAGIESGGNYSILGPVTNGDRAYGKFQIMGANIGPWTKQVLGQELTPQQFLASPQAQDAVFQAKFGNYVQKYGPEGAARAWFAGEGGMNDPNRRDILGTSVADYANKFNAGLGGGVTGGLLGQPATPGPGLLGNLTSGAPTGQGNPLMRFAGMGQPQQPQMMAPPQMPMLPPRRPLDLSRIQAMLSQSQPTQGWGF